MAIQSFLCPVTAPLLSYLRTPLVGILAWRKMRLLNFQIRYLMRKSQVPSGLLKSLKPRAQMAFMRDSFNAFGYLLENQSKRKWIRFSLPPLCRSIWIGPSLLLFPSAAILSPLAITDLLVYVTLCTRWLLRWLWLEFGPCSRTLSLPTKQCLCLVKRE